jgi:hypothetical protein
LEGLVASSEYKVAKTYLHKENDQDVIRYIEGLPDCLRQKFLRESLTYYRRLLEGSGIPDPLVSTSDKTAPVAGASFDVLRKFSL